MIFFLLDELEEVLEHVIVGAGVDSGGHILLRFMFFLDLPHKHLNFFLEKLVAFILVIFISWLKLDLNQIGA